MIIFCETDAPVGRRALGKRAKLARIRAAAHRLFSERGFEDTTTRQIAEAADIGAGTLFLYARTKEDLLVLVFQDEIGRAVDAAFDVIPDAPLLEQVLHVFDAMVRQHAADPRLARVFVKELPFVDAASHRGVADFVANLYTRLSALIEAAKGRGEIARDVPSRLLAQNLFGLFFQHLQMWLGGRAGALEPGDPRLRDALALQLHAVAGSSEAASNGAVRKRTAARKKSARGTPRTHETNEEGRR